MTTFDLRVLADAVLTEWRHDIAAVSDSGRGTRARRRARRRGQGKIARSGRRHRVAGQRPRRLEQGSAGRPKRRTR